LSAGFNAAGSCPVIELGKRGEEVPFRWDQHCPRLLRQIKFGQQVTRSGSGSECIFPNEDAMLHAGCQGRAARMPVETGIGTRLEVSSRIAFGLKETPPRVFLK